MHIFPSIRHIFWQNNEYFLLLSTLIQWSGLRITDIWKNIFCCIKYILYHLITQNSCKFLPFNYMYQSPNNLTSFTSQSLCILGRYTLCLVFHGVSAIRKSIAGISVCSNVPTFGICKDVFDHLSPWSSCKRLFVDTKERQSRAQGILKNL